MASQSQFQYTTLAHQTAAVQSLADVFNDVRFIQPNNIHVNPTLLQGEVAEIIKSNIEAIRIRNKVSAGSISVPITTTPALNLDILMETGTGKTFTFIETMHRLHRDKKLSKFIILVPSNAIRQGTLKSLQSTAEFFSKQYGQKINVFNYSAKTVSGFIHAANTNIAVMVATYQSFAGDSKLINKRGVEANLFGRAKSFMEALAIIRPVLIIDEPHRFEGTQTQEYLAKFNPLFTIRFGATFKGKNDDEKYRNLIYTLDSLEAFRQRLVKGIVVDTVGGVGDTEPFLCYLSHHGTAKERTATVQYRTASGKTASIQLSAKSNLGCVAGMPFLEGYIVDKITPKELLFDNGFALPLNERTAYGMLAEQTQSLIIERAIANHFDREEILFRQGIKSLSLFFIDSVAKYMPEGQGTNKRPTDIRNAFEKHYNAHLERTLAKPYLYPPYRAYLERSAEDIGKVHKGYFARSHSEKGEEEAIKLILQEKEKLLSFDTDLRFIFSMWALQEGWDNPNVFTLCKLAPSHSQITKLQQIGRGLRLAVNQQLQRLQNDDPEFDQINELTVVVPASEGDFVEAIQSEIAAHSVQRVARVFDDKTMIANGIAPSSRVALRMLDSLAELGVLSADDVKDEATLLLDRNTYHAMRSQIIEVFHNLKGLEPANARAMLNYLDAYYDGYGAVKRKQDKIRTNLTINANQYQKFKALWESLNRDAILRYELDTPALLKSIQARIQRDFEVRPLNIHITRTQKVQSLQDIHSIQTSYAVQSHKIYTLSSFITELANSTRLSYHTIASVLKNMPADKFTQIQHNEGRALVLLRDVITCCIYELLVHKVSYQLRETRVKTALTNAKGELVSTIPTTLCGVEIHPIDNAEVRKRSLFDEPIMPVDSQIERDTVNESARHNITVFAKLPKVDIPTPVGKYNPDFAYVIDNKIDNKINKELYLVVETKGYDNFADIPEKERLKIDSAKRFFQSLREAGIPVQFQTKLNRDQLLEIIQSISKESP
ncbi:MAG: hypothetical protein RIR79_1044 [Pseudomonadota bacterium]|jgi:type III restriction enzyme